MGILGLGRKKKVAEPEPEPEVLEVPTGPPLALLVPEAAGVTSYHLMRFYDTAEAAAYLESVRHTAAPGIHAFWALNDRPGDDVEGEAMVLIRSNSTTGMVYVVSFVDIDSALSFARFEVKRGLSIGSLIVWWAAEVTISETEEGIQFTPDEPPEAKAGVPGAASPALTLSPRLERARQR